MTGRYRITDSGWQEVERTFRQYGADRAPVICRGECGAKPHYPHLTEYGHAEHRRVMLAVMANEGAI